MMSSDQPFKKVVGLSYKKGDTLPKIILKGSGYTAEDIIKEGERLKEGPMVIQNQELAKQLYKMSIDTEIQPAAFEMVAAILAHLYAVDERYKEEQPWMP